VEIKVAFLFRPLAAGFPKRVAAGGCGYRQKREMWVENIRAMRNERQDDGGWGKGNEQKRTHKQKNMWTRKRSRRRKRIEGAAFI